MPTYSEILEEYICILSEVYTTTLEPDPLTGHFGVVQEWGQQMPVPGSLNMHGISKKRPEELRYNLNKKPFLNCKSLVQLNQLYDQHGPFILTFINLFLTCIKFFIYVFVSNLIVPHVP